MINEHTTHKFCKDDISEIENYDKAIADTTHTWHCHHRLELTLDGEYALSKDQLIMYDMYYHRPHYELIFLTPAEHVRLHNQARSVETRRKLSEANVGHTVSAETRKKMSDKLRGHKFRLGTKHTVEARQKMSEARKAYWRTRHEQSSIL